MGVTGQACGTDDRRAWRWLLQPLHSLAPKPMRHPGCCTTPYSEELSGAAGERSAGLLLVREATGPASTWIACPPYICRPERWQNLHCPEMETPFLAVWYVAGKLIPVAVDTFMGPRVLHR